MANDGSFRMNNLTTWRQQPMKGGEIGPHLPWTLIS